MACKTFTFETESGTKLVAPRFDQIKAGVIRKAKKQPDALDQLFFILEQVLTDKNLAAYDDLTMGEAAEFMKAWQEESSPTAGESGASSKN